MCNTYYNHFEILSYFANRNIHIGDPRRRSRLSRRAQGTGGWAGTRLRGLWIILARGLRLARRLFVGHRSLTDGVLPSSSQGVTRQHAAIVPAHIGQLRVCVTLVADDYEGAIDFYVRAIGCELVHDGAMTLDCADAPGAETRVPLTPSHLNWTVLAHWRPAMRHLCPFLQHLRLRPRLRPHSRAAECALARYLAARP